MHEWIIELDPEVGKAGGIIIAKGTPEEIKNSAGSITGRNL